MQFFKRLGEALTPPPRRGQKSPPAQPESAALRKTDEELSAELRRLVRALIDSESAEEHARVRARTELTELARSHGVYATAAKIRMVLESLGQDQGDPSRYEFGRVHVLLSEFVFQHLFNEIAAMESGERQLGPNIFGTYCSDLIDALCTGRGPHAALEMGLHITERCLYNAADSLEKRDLYLQLAEAAIRCTRDQLEQALRQSTRGRATPVPRHTGGPTPNPESATVVRRGNQCIEYAREVHARVSRLRSDLGLISHRPGISRAELRTLGGEQPVPPDAAHPSLVPRLRTHLEYLTAAMEAARKSEYLPFVAHLEERTGRTLRARMVVEGQSDDLARATGNAYAAAATTLERQGDRENGLGLLAISVQRYTKAMELCVVSADDVRAVALQEKLATLRR